MADLGTLVTSFGADLAPLKRSAMQAETQFHKFQKGGVAALEKVKKAVFSLQTVIGGLTFGAVIHDIIKTGAQFEQTMAEVKGISRATSAEFAAMTDVVKELGATTEWTASQAGEGLKFLSMAGFSAVQSIEALSGVLDLATAGNIELGRAADIASNALTAMRLPVEQLTRVNDVFVKTITTSNTDMEMMAEAFKYSASISAAFGYRIEQLSAYIGLLGNAGIQGSMAGTQLAAAFQSVSKVFEYYNVQAGKGQKYTNDLTGAIRLLQERGATATEVMDIFGQRSGRGVAALLGIGIDALDKYSKKIMESTGAAENLATVMRSTTIGAWKELKSALEAVEIELFTARTGELNDLGKALTRTVRDMQSSIVFLINKGIDVATMSIKVLTGWLICKSFSSFLTWTSSATVGLGKVNTAVNLLRFSIKTLGRAALYGLIVEGISRVITAFSEMNTFVKETTATWGASTRLAMDNVVNSFVNSIIALGHSMHNIMRIITDPIIAAFTSFSIKDLLFGDLTKEQAWESITSSMGKAFKDALARIGDDFHADMSRRIFHIASEADRLLLQNWRAPKPSEFGPERPERPERIEGTESNGEGRNTVTVDSVNKTIDAYKKLIEQLKFEKSLLKEDEVVQRAMTLARQNDIKIGSGQYDVILKLVTAYDTEAQRIAEIQRVEAQRIEETKRIQEERLQSIQDFNAQYMDLGKSQFELDKQHVRDQAALWREAAEATITNENELADKKIEIAQLTSSRIKQIKQAETTEVMGMYANMTGQVSGMFMQIAQAGGEHSKKAFMMYKAFAMVQAGIAGAQAYLLALGDPTVPATTARLILANIILGITAAQIGMIASTQPPSYDEGGISHARGIYQTGNIDEAHIPLKGGRIPVKMEKQEEKAPVEVTILNAFDPMMIDEYIYSSQGQSAILNVIGNRSQTVRRILR